MRFRQSLLRASLPAVAVACLFAVSQLAAQENGPDEETAASITDELAGLEAAVATGELTKKDAALAFSLSNRIVLPPSDIHMIGFGEEVRLDDYVGEGRTTIIDFFSKYCAPCLQISPLLEELAAKGSDIRVVKVNIDRPGVVGTDWDSPVAEQFSLRSRPHFQVYGPDERLLAQGDQAIQMILDLYRSQDVRQSN